MTKRDSGRLSTRSEHDDTYGVTALVATITHPMKPTLEAMRRTVLAADSAITEGVKWNSPSFYCHGWFATIVTRQPTQLDVVLHCGAKVHAGSEVSQTIDDPEGLLTWPSRDRAIVSFGSDSEFQTSKQSFGRIIRQWAAYQKRSAGGADAGSATRKKEAG
ncbi:MAG: DUF1801 domain-containing protein [Chthoniobacterales bacterium]